MSASGINDNGDIVGYYKDGNCHGFLYDGSTYTTIDDPNANGNTKASGINNNRDIVGYFTDSNYSSHGFLYHNGTYTTLDDPNASEGFYYGTEATGINDSGDIVGSYKDSNGNCHGFLYHNGIYTTLDDPNASEEFSFGTVADGINNNGDIVGEYEDINRNYHGFLYRNGVYTTFDDPNGETCPYGISNNGDIVGYYLGYGDGLNPSEGAHGFLYDGSTYTTLDGPLALSPYGGIGTEATGINDNGDIVGIYDGDGFSPGFEAVPASNSTVPNGTFASVETINADGSTFTKYYDSTSSLLSDSWAKPDGSYGTDTFNYDMNGNLRSTLNETTNPDGSSTTFTYDTATGVYGYDQVNADGSWTDYQTIYDNNGGYNQIWEASNGTSGENDKSADGSTLTSRTNADGSSTISTYDAVTGVYGYDQVNADGSWTDYQTTYDNNGGYKQSWTANNGTSGVNDKSDDGSTLNTTNNPDGSSTTSTYDATTGVYGYDQVNADGSWTDYQTTYDNNGGYNQTWTASDGSFGENDMSDTGSTLTSRTNADGSSTISSYDASTGVYGYEQINADKSFTDYLTTYDAGGGYKQSWTASDGSFGENDKSDNGSTMTSRTNADGSSTISTYDAATGVYEYDQVNADGSWTDYQTIYDNNGGYNQTWEASKGTSGENDKSDDGSTLNKTVNADGSSTISTYDAATGVYGYDQINADKSFTDYLTTYDAAGGYMQSWLASDGSFGENDKLDDGNTMVGRANSDGSAAISTYNAATGLYDNASMSVDQLVQAMASFASQVSGQTAPIGTTQLFLQSPLLAASH